MNKPHSTQGWDKIVRSIHWIVATLFIINYYFTEAGYTAHIRVGWTIFGLVIFRILWGITKARGPNHIRNFIPTINGIKEHLVELRNRESLHQVGHNACGSIVIFLMWFCLLTAAFTGWLQDTDWGFENDVYEWHEFFVESLWYLIVMHITAVILTSLWLRKNLIKQMILGK